MKHSPQPHAQQKAIAIGFTLGVHTVALIALLYLGLSVPPKPPERMQAVLIKPEYLPHPKPEADTEISETVHQKVAAEIQQTAEPVPAAPVIPSTAAPIKVETSPAETTLAKQNAENAARRAQAEQRAEAEAKLKAELAAKQRAEAAANAQATADAKAKAAADAKAKAAADAKAKAAAEAKAKAAAEAREQAEQEAKASAAKKASEDAAQKKAEAKRIASTAKRDFTNKIQRAWDVPAGSTGKQATARVTLSDSGAVLSVVVSASDPDMKASVEAAVRAAAPYPMPADPDARREARSFSSTFTAR